MEALQILVKNMEKKDIRKQVFAQRAKTSEAFVQQQSSLIAGKIFALPQFQDASCIYVYPVLRRLLKDDCLEVYDMEFGGRNRRYYKITERGMAQLQLYKTEWKEYSARIGNIFDGGEL